MSDVVDALTEYNNQLITEAQLLRRLLSYPAWYVLCEMGDGLEYGAPSFDITKVIALESEEGLNALPLFSDEEAFESYRKTANSDEVTGVCISGFEFFAANLEEVDAVVLNPGQPEGFLIAKDRFDAAQDLSQAIKIEQAWQRLRTGNEEEKDLNLVTRYEGYYCAIVEHEGHTAFCHIINDDELPFVPLFTHSDALAQAMPELQESFGQQLKTPRVSAKAIFPAIATEKATGIVFNYLGPTEPAAFSMEVTDLLLEELARHEK